MRRILIPIDFTPQSLDAICYAIRFFGNQQVTFFLVYITPDKSDSNTLIAIQDLLHKEADKKMKKIKEHIIEGFPQYTPVVETMICTGEFMSELVNAALEFEIDCVVMSMATEAKILQLLDRKESRRIGKKLKAPILMLPRNFEAPHDHQLFA